MLTLLGFARNGDHTASGTDWLMRRLWPKRIPDRRPPWVGELSPHLLRDIGLWDDAGASAELQTSGRVNSRPHCGS